MLTLENPASHRPATVASSAVLHIGEWHRLRRRGLHGLAVASENRFPQSERGSDLVRHREVPEEAVVARRRVREQGGKPMFFLTPS